MSSNTITTYVKSGTVSTTLNVVMDPEYNQVFAGFTYYSDDTYAVGVEVTPGAGTVAITGKPLGTGAFVALDNAVSAGSPLDATAIGNQLTTNVPLSDLKAVPTGITTATHYRMTVTAKKV